VGGVVGGTPGKYPTGEVADSISGGGFSNLWPAPAYQQAAIKNYLATASNIPPQRYWNASGRGYPDVAAQSEVRGGGAGRACGGGGVWCVDDGQVNVSVCVPLV
jgi:hypothetical protein